MHSNLRAYTLVELLLIIALIGVLAVGVLVLINPSNALKKANDARRKSDLSQMQRLMELYYHDNGQYPAGSAVSFGNPFLPYSPSLPQDPVTTKRYAYITTGQEYYIYASLDLGSTDPQACFAGTANAGIVACPHAATANCGGICNYGVSSSNVTP